MSGDAIEWTVYGAALVWGVTGIWLDALDGKGKAGTPDYATGATLNYTLATFALVLILAKALGAFAAWLK